MPDFAPRVRWDRVGRVALLLVGVLLVCLYINPARTYFSTWREAGAKREEVAKLQHEHRRLVQRRRALENPRTLEREARRLGMVRPDERPYVIRDLP
jgi:cell division protein FtsB